MSIPQPSTKPPDPHEGHDPQTGERFTKSSDLLIGLGLPPRLVLLYGRLAFHAGKDGKCFVRHDTLATEIGLRGKYRDRQVRKLLNRLRDLHLISWERRGPRCNDFVIHPPKDRNWSSAKTGTGVPLKDRNWSSDRKEYIGVLKEVLKEEPPLPPQRRQDPKQQKLPGLCPSDDGRARESALAKTSRSGGDHHQQWFDAWWPNYWRKVAKQDAQKAFKKHVRTEELFQQVMAATQAQTPMMMAREPDKRPHAATWINGARWNDEPSQPARAGPQKASAAERLKARWAEKIAKGERPL